MIEIEIRGTSEAIDYIEKIVNAMVSLFSVTRAEAVGRVNKHWRNRDFFTAMSVSLLVRERPDFWAKTIYYPADVKWWKGESGLKARPYP